MTAKKNPIDYRPFRPKAEHLLEERLEAQYRGVAIPELVAALASRKDDPARTTKILPSR